MISVHCVSKCGKRPQNEDKHTIILNLDKHDKTIQPVNFYGIYDGHGGKYVSNFLSENLPKHFIDKSVEYPLNGRVINNIYKRMNTELKQNIKNRQHIVALHV